MQQRVGASTRRVSLIVLAPVLLVGVLVVSWLLGQVGYASPDTATKLAAPADRVDSPGMVTGSQATEGGIAYLPLVGRQFPPPPPIFGTEIRQLDTQNSALAADAGVHWVRYSAFHWDEIEPVTGTYDWSKVDEAGLKSAADQGMEIIATIKFTPEWAQKIPGKYCGPITEDALDEYAQFLDALVKRYGAPPYNIRYWELGNEPDVDPRWVEDRAVYGCWGDENDPYYGGGYYATMLKAAYPAIKKADPQASVLIGGLLLDCDPSHPPDGKECKPARFLEGILLNGGGSFFDIVSFHGYPLFDGTLKGAEAYPAWEIRDGVVLGKIQFLREVMASHGIDKPLMHTEGALLCHSSSPICNPVGAEFFEAQADYVIWLFVRNWAEGLRATIWYQFEGPGWRHSGLLDGNQQPKPAYNALKFLSQELANAAYRKRVADYPEVRAFEFSAPAKKIWVMWAEDEQPHTIVLPSAPHKVYDKYGTDITPATGTITVQSPVYVEWVP